MAFTFEKLIVYQEAVDFADQITCLTGTFPRGFYFLADHLNRASLSARQLDLRNDLAGELRSVSSGPTGAHHEL
jgi:hypothetical protein